MLDGRMERESRPNGSRLSCGRPASFKRLLGSAALHSSRCHCRMNTGGPSARIWRLALLVGRLKSHEVVSHRSCRLRCAKTKYGSRRENEAPHAVLYNGVTTSICALSGPFQRRSIKKVKTK